MKTKMELKDVFAGASTLMYQSEAVNLSSEGEGAVLNPEYELPVTVDTLQVSQEDATINHYKIIGLDGDWTSTATLGDMTVAFTVPTKATDVLKLAFGDDAVEENVKASLNGTGYTGTTLKMKKHKITGCFIIENEEGDQLMILNNIAMWATVVWDNTSTEPVAVKFNGTLEVGDAESYAWLKKNA